MAKTTLPSPRIVSPRQWLAQRKKLLAREKALTREYDRVSAQRRRLPMVKIEKDYVFTGPKRKLRLVDLFAGHRQLIVYHFMFDPEWRDGCPSCTAYVDALPDLSPLRAKDTQFVLISHAPLPKLTAYQRKRGWKLPWFSSFGSEFNYDFHVTLDARVAPIEYNYRDEAQMVIKKIPNPKQGETHGMSVFFRLGTEVFHTYSAYARGTEGLADTNHLLDITPYGRQQKFEDSPPGWPQQPTYG